MFLAPTIVACLFVGQFNLVRERKVMRTYIKEKGGLVRTREDWRPLRDPEQTILPPKSKAGVPLWRQWIGDEPAADVLWPRGSLASDIDQAMAAFPEAEQRVYVASDP
jgi:hypothetical protein